MERENRYLVIKRKDIEEYLSYEQRMMLDSLADNVKYRRLLAGKRDDTFVCVADDWPEYEPTWAAIEKRVNSSKESNDGD